MHDQQSLSHAAAVERFRQIIAQVTAERSRQDQKWGEQNHGFAHYNAILIEEVGEMSNAYLEQNGPALREEMIQTAAVLVAMLECGDRNGWFTPKENETITHVNLRTGERGPTIQLSERRKADRRVDHVRAAQPCPKGHANRRVGSDRRKA